MRLYHGAIAGELAEKPLDRLHIIEISPEEFDTLQQIPMRDYYEKSQYGFCKQCNKEIKINNENVIALDRGIYFCRKHEGDEKHQEPLTPLEPECNQCDQPLTRKTDFYLLETGEISKSKTSYFQCQCKEHSWLIFKQNFGTFEEHEQDPPEVNYICRLNTTQYYEDYDDVFVKVKNKELGNSTKKSSLFLHDFLYSKQPKKYRHLYRVIEETTKIGIQLEVLNQLCNAHRRSSVVDQYLGINPINSLKEIIWSDYTYFDSIIEEKIKSTIVSIRYLFDPSVRYSLLKWNNRTYKRHNRRIKASDFYCPYERNKYRDRDINKTNGKRIILQGILHQDDKFLDKFDKKFDNFQEFVKTDFVNNLSDFYKDFIPPFLNNILKYHKLSIHVDDTTVFRSAIEISRRARSELYNLCRHRDYELAEIKRRQAQQEKIDENYAGTQ